MKRIEEKKREKQKRREKGMEGKMGRNVEVKAEKGREDDHKKGD